MYYVLRTNKENDLYLCKIGINNADKFSHKAYLKNKNHILPTSTWIRIDDDGTKIEMKEKNEM
jgi:hypothetical protein